MLARESAYMIFRTNPSPRVVQFYAFAWIAVYALFYFFLRDLIPEKFLRDAAEIQRLMETNYEDVSLSYATPAYLFQLLPMPALHILVGLINCAVLYYILRRIKTTDGMIAAAFILPPMILLDFMSPTKEVFVILMALTLLYCANRFSRNLPMLIAISIAYCVYGLAFRPYYLLILFCFLLFFYFPRNRLLQLSLFLMALVILFLLPKNIFETLQGPRDDINFISQSEGPFEVRTAFYNPFPPDNMWAFMGNYGYAFLRLHFPIFWDITLNEWVLFANVLIYAALVRYGIKFLSGPRRILVLLFLAHVTVLIFFEPDLGSYFRHFSSVFLYLLPAFILREQETSAQNQRIKAA